MCLNVTCSKVRLGKHLSDTFPIQNGMKHCLSTLLYNTPLWRSKKIREDWNWMEHISSCSTLTVSICWANM